MDVILVPLIDVIRMALNLYLWAIIINVILSWLVAFNIINTHQPIVSTIGRFLYQITEPALRPIRRVVPQFGGLDITPIVLILAIYLVDGILVRIRFQF